MSMNQTTPEIKSDFASTSKQINLNTPTNPEIRGRIQKQELRNILKNKLFELNSLQSEWNAKENEYRSQCEDLISQLRDIDVNFINQKNSERTKHLEELDRISQQHQTEVNDFQTKIEENFLGLNSPSEIEQYDEEIASLNEELLNLEEPQSEEQEVDSEYDAIESRIKELEEQHQESLQLHEEAIRQRDEDSKTSTQMIEQLLAKTQEEEEYLQKEIQNLIEQLTKLDQEHNNKCDEINRIIQEDKKNISNSRKGIMNKISEKQKILMDKQNEHISVMQKLQNEVEELRSTLESCTTRQKQQIKEIKSVAKKYATEKKKYATMHKELEMVHAELVRESIEHEVLMKDLSKLDTEHTGTVVVWLQALSNLHSNKISFAGFESSGKKLDFTNLVQELVVHALGGVDLTQEITNALGEFAVSSGESTTIETTTNSSADPVVKEGNILKLEDLLGVNLNIEDLGIQIQTANDVIGSIFGFINSSLSVFIIWLIATVFFLFQFFACCFIWKAKAYAQPSCLLKIFAFLCIACIIISSVFFIMGYQGADYFVEPMTILESTILKEICQSLYEGLNSIFHGSNTGMIYQMLNPYFVNMTNRVSTFNGTIYSISQNVIITIENYLNQLQDIIKKANNTNDEINAILKDMQTQGYPNVPSGGTFDFKTPSDALSEISSQTDSISKEIDRFCGFTDTLSSEIMNISASLIDPSTAGIDEVINELRDYANKPSTSHDSGFGKFIDQLSNYYGTWKGIYIAVGACMIVTALLYYFCFHFNNATARCCSSASAVCPFIFNTLLMLVAFVATIIGGLCLETGNLTNDTLDGLLKSAVKEIAPNNTIEIPAISFAGVTNNLITGNIEGLKIDFNPDEIKLMENIPGLYSQISEQEFGFTEVANLPNVINLSKLSVDITSAFSRLANSFELPTEITDCLDQISAELGDMPFKQSFDEFFSTGLFELINQIMSILNANDTTKEDLVNRLNQVNESLNSLSTQYLVLYDDVNELNSYFFNQSTKFLTETRRLISSVGGCFGDVVEKLFDIINIIKMNKIIEYYPQLFNSYSFGVPFLAASLSLSTHLFIIGTAFLVLLLWYHRKDQLNIKHKKESSYSYSSKNKKKKKRGKKSKKKGYVFDVYDSGDDSSSVQISSNSFSSSSSDIKSQSFSQDSEPPPPSPPVPSPQPEKSDDDEDVKSNSESGMDIYKIDNSSGYTSSDW
ncbi:hypothetical protein GPJ56_006720 [Histomonas meleagridis]|uniref:uncharacterized protein n=1 Tax=Histomonas meleagridis TaxID=135588 RepID=UPI00355A0D2D|nr:hypothetical protein GPJ56_006720 [Histomonas meleagridis]KAH0805916.1 hypothetical protein GO595_001247 [Histomonas meleagridis]